LIKTLYGYLGRDLAKVTLLALLGFTLMMTVFAVVEPLRKYGLGADKALGLIEYTLPMMMSLTLPIAALFAATIVYGRFGQDNEMTACRASGISSLAVLRPALWLGGIVTVISLFLGSFVTPQIIQTLETAIKSNVRDIAYQQLRTKSGLRWKAKNLMIHADNVDARDDKIEGLVVARMDKEEQVQFVAAAKALVNFSEEDEETWLTFHLVDAAPASTREDFQGTGTFSPPPYSVRLPSLAKEDPSWYDWPKLVRTLRNPAESREIRKKLEEIRLTLSYDMLARAIAKKINQSDPCGLRKSEGGFGYQVRAKSASVEGPGCVRLESSERGAEPERPVEVLVTQDGAAYQVITAQRGVIEVGPSQISPDSYVSIELTGDVKVNPVADRRAPPQKRIRWRVGEIPIPEGLVTKAESIPLAEICRRAEELTDDPKIIGEIIGLRDHAIRRLLNKIKAEMHMRAAYGSSCFLMVAMGAALGLVLRGGQIITAFAISVVPASLVIVMMMMGKQMVRNPDVSVAAGLLAIWVGVLVLLGANVLVYYCIARR